MQNPMSKHPRSRVIKRLVGAMLIAFVLVALIVIPSRPSKVARELAYWTQGTAWMNPHLTWEENHQRRLDALRQMGQPAVRELVKELRRSDERPGSDGYLALFQRFLPASPSQSGRQRLAIILLRELGPQAQAAVPDLLELLQHHDRMIRLEAVRALVCIGENAPDVLSALTGLYGDPAVEVRQAAAIAVWRLNHTDEQAALRIEAMLVNTNRSWRDATAGVCYQDIIAAGPAAKRFAPFCATGMTNVENRICKTLAAKALLRITGSTEGVMYVLGVLTNALRNAPVPVVTPVNPELGEFGDFLFAVQEFGEVREFRLAVEPSLIALTNCPDRTIGEMASSQLQRIRLMNSTNGPVP